jgi:predicted 3-demethylubiquinone-9 3-methyltransferase (glyoxalase superfamily)
MISKNTICLWYDGTALDAAMFYATTFPDSAVGAVHRAPGDYPAGRQGDVLTVEFTVMGIPGLGLNGSSGVPHTDAFSFQVATDDQAETTACGTRSSTAAARPTPVAGARIDGACRGRSPRAP